MTLTRKLALSGAVASLLLLTAIVGFTTAKATPSQLCRDATASATTSLAFLSPGAGTTTLTVDKLAITAAGLYLSKNLFSTQDGRFMGVGPKPKA